MLNGPDWVAKWDTTGSQRLKARNKIEALVLQHSGEILNSVVGSMFQQVIQQMTYNR